MTGTLVVMFTIVGLTTFLVGFVLGRDTRHPIDVKDLDAYMNKAYPSVWTAYHRGIDEGYQQGLRDRESDG